MPAGLYDKGRNKFARAEIGWKAAGGANVKAFLIDAASYTVDLAAHEFLSDVPAGARKGASGGNTRADAIALVKLDPVAGVCDSNDITFTPGIPAGAALEAILLFVDDGVADASSPLVGYWDNWGGLPVTPNGQDIIAAPDNGANKIFKL